MLTGRQQRFVIEYVKDFDHTKAYIRAGYSENGAAQSACALLREPKIQEAIEAEKEMRAAVAGLRPEWILHQWMMIASADPADLMRVELRRCVNCWEMNDAELPINPECKSCKGDGERVVYVADTRSLKGPARRLFAGVKQTKDGIEIKFRDQSEALRNLADYLGMQNKSSGTLGVGVVPLDRASVADLSDDQLMAIAAAGSLPSNANMGVLEGVSAPQLPSSTTIEGTY